MKNDDIILDILEKIHAKVEKLDGDVQDIRIEQVRHGLMHEANKEELAEHARRSTASEGRLNVLEDDAKFFKSFVKIVTVLGAIATFISRVYPFLVAHL